MREQPAWAATFTRIFQFFLFMFKPLLVLLFGLLSFAAHAQATPVAPAAPTPPARFELTQGRRDTLGAITSMFQRRRRGGKVWVGIGAGGILALLRVVANPNTTTVNGVQTSSEVDGGAVAVVGLGFVALPAAIGIGKLARFSEKRENDVDRAYRGGQPLPRRIARRLTRQDFRQ